MNDKQNQIEEMAKVMCGGCHNGKECMRCLCPDWYKAEMLYDADVRKIPEGSVVLSKEEYEYLKYQESLLSKTALITKEEFLMLHDNYNQARKETASEIFETLIEVCKRGYVLHLDTLIANAKRFGVEV